MTLGDLLKNLRLPKFGGTLAPPTDYRAGIITLSRAVGPPELGGSIERPFRWDGAKQQLASGDEALQAADRITIDLRKPVDPSLGAAPGQHTSAAGPGSKVSITLRTDDGPDVQSSTAVNDGEPLADLLKRMAYPHPIDLRGAVVELTHPYGGYDRDGATTWAIALQPETGEPHPSENRAVHGGDSIKIHLHPKVELAPASAAAVPAQAAAPDYPDATPPMRPQTASADRAAPTSDAVDFRTAPDAVEFHMGFIEDLSGDLAEFANAGDSNGITIRQTAVLGPALRVLEKHGLIKTLNNPRIRTAVGRPAEFALAEPIEGTDRAFHPAQRIRILGHHAGRGPDGRTLIVEVEASATHGDRKFEVKGGLTMLEGETALVKMRTPEGKKSGPLYVAVTPEWVD